MAERKVALPAHEAAMKKVLTRDVSTETLINACRRAQRDGKTLADVARGTGVDELVFAAWHAAKILSTPWDESKSTAQPPVVCWPNHSWDGS